MPGERALKPTEAPEKPQKSRLQKALDLITDEAAETLVKGRNPRAYKRTEKLLAIVRALRIECAENAEDFLAEGHGDGLQKTGRVQFGDNLTINTANEGELICGAEIGPYEARKGARSDMQREEKLAQLEALSARCRRDDAEARLALIREFKELASLDLSGQPDFIQEGIKARITEITDKLRTEESKEESA